MFNKCELIGVRTLFSCGNGSHSRLGQRWYRKSSVWLVTDVCLTDRSHVVTIIVACHVVAKKYRFTQTWTWKWRFDNVLFLVQFECYIGDTDGINLLSCIAFFPPPVHPQPLLLTGHHGEISAMTFGKGSRPFLLCSASADYVIVWNIELCQRRAQEGKKKKESVSCAKVNWLSSSVVCFIHFKL